MQSKMNGEPEHIPEFDQANSTVLGAFKKMEKRLKLTKGYETFKSVRKKYRSYSIDFKKRLILLFQVVARESADFGQTRGEKRMC